MLGEKIQNEWHWQFSVKKLQLWKWKQLNERYTNLFSKPCPQKGTHNNLKWVFQTIQFKLNLTCTKPQFAKKQTQKARCTRLIDVAFITS